MIINMLSNQRLSLRSDIHLSRKLWHVSTGLLGVVLHYQSALGKSETASILLIIGLLGFFIDFLRLRIERLNLFLIGIMKPLMRESERDSYSGLPFYALGASLTLFFYPEDLAVTAILCLAIADPIGSTVGILKGKTKLIGSKSLEGSLACLIAAMGTAYLWLPYEGFELLCLSLVAGVGTAFVELLTGDGLDDNLAIPIFTGACLSVASFLF